MASEMELLEKAADILGQREKIEACLRDVDNRLRAVISEYSIVSRVWGYDRHKLRIVCEMRGLLPKKA